jgi:SAM-dependent methyltransferase
LKRFIGVSAIDGLMTSFGEDNMSARIYERLSRVYDQGWGQAAGKYENLINNILKDMGIGRARILDLGCGTGTLAIELAKAGHAVHGIDISPQMIEAAEAKADNPWDVSFEIGDMTEFTVADKFDLVCCTFNSINYLMEQESVRSFLRCVTDALFESGIFVFDSNTDRLYQKRHNGSFDREYDGISFIQRCNYDRSGKVATTIFEFADGTSEIHKQRAYDLIDLGLMLGEAGLQIVHLYSDFDGNPYDAASEQMICVASPG